MSYGVFYGYEFVPILQVHFWFYVVSRVQVVLGRVLGHFVGRVGVLAALVVVGAVVPFGSEYWYASKGVK